MQKIKEDLLVMKEALRQLNNIAALLEQRIRTIEGRQPEPEPRLVLRHGLRCRIVDKSPKV